MAFALPYRFVTLSPQQIDERRSILNRHGFYAWLSPIVILISISLFQAALKFRNAAGSTTSSKGAKAPTASELRIRRLKWWLSSPLTPEFGARQVHLLGLAYAIWLLVLAAHQTSDDYMHVTKQLGHVAIAQLPMHYLLAVKSPKSPVQMISGLSYETLLPYHRIFGRIIHLLFLAHGVLYMNFFKQADLLPKRLASKDALLGLLALTLFNILGVTSIPPIRKAAYHNVFYKAHVVISMLVVPVLFFHVPYTRLYVAQCFLLGVFNALSRKGATTPKVIAKVELVTEEDSNLIKLTVPNPKSGGIQNWVPGQHCYLKQDLSPMLARSPFTIISSSTQSPNNEIQLVLRNLGGALTGWVAANATNQKPFEVMLEGPYGESAAYVPSLVKDEDGDVLLVAGGIGATYTLPIYISLLQELVQRKKGTKSHIPLSRDRRITFVWVVKSKQDTFWALKALVEAGLSDPVYSSIVDIRVYVTNTPRPAPEPKTSHFILDSVKASDKMFEAPPTGRSVTNELFVTGRNAPKLNNKNTSSTTSTDTDALSLSTKLRTSRIQSSSNRSSVATSKISTVESDIPPTPPTATTTAADSSSSTTSSTSPPRSSSPATPPTETEADIGNETRPRSSVPHHLQHTTTPEPAHITSTYTTLLSPFPTETSIKIKTHTSTRPPLGSLITEILSQPPFTVDSATCTIPTAKNEKASISYDKVTVLMCGPDGLVEEVREEVGKHVVGYGRDIRVWREGFGHG